jgi:hypothetical protein
LSRAAKETTRDRSFGCPSQTRGDLLIAQWSINLGQLSYRPGAKRPAGLADYRHRTHRSQRVRPDRGHNCRPARVERALASPPGGKFGSRVRGSFNAIVLYTFTCRENVVLRCTTTRNRHMVRRARAGRTALLVVAQ